MNEQTFSFIAYSLFPFVALALGYVVYFLFQVPVKIYNSQLIKLEKYDWSRIDIEPKPFETLGLSGWGVAIINKKGIALDEVSIWLHGVRKGQDWKISNDDSERFGYLNIRAEILSFNSTKILPTKNEIFVITACEDGIPGMNVLAQNKKINVVQAESFAIDISVDAKIESYKLPLKLIRLNIYPNGEISIRKDYEKDK